MPRTHVYWSAMSMTLKGSPSFEVKSVQGHEMQCSRSLVDMSPDMLEIKSPLAKINT